MKFFEKIVYSYREYRVLSKIAGSLSKVPRVKDFSPVLRKYKLSKNSKSLDIGCGSNPRNPFFAEAIYGIDIRKNLGENIKCADLIIEPIPFENNFFDSITAYDFLERIPRVIYTPKLAFPFVQVMNEVWRCLKPGGIFLSHTPVFPFPESFRDPTHVNIFTNETFSLYFDDNHSYASMYGFSGKFEIVEQKLFEPHLLTILRKVDK